MQQVGNIVNFSFQCFCVKSDTVVNLLLSYDVFSHLSKHETVTVQEQDIGNLPPFTVYGFQAVSVGRRQCYGIKSYPSLNDSEHL